MRWIQGIKKKNNQVSRIHNPISPFTVPTCIKLRPLSKLYVTVQQDFLMTIYKKKKTFFTWWTTTTIIVIVIIVMTTSFIIITIKTLI